MTPVSHSSVEHAYRLNATGALVRIRPVAAPDLPQIAAFGFTVSISEPLTSLDRLREVHASSGFALADAGAVAIEEKQTARLVGTLQYYRPGPCIHGLELGYIVHALADRGKGYAAEALRLFSDALFAREEVFARADGFARQQLLIEVWNTASWKVAERCGFLREGVLRSSGLGTGDPADSFVYSRTRTDYRQERASNNGSIGHGHIGNDT